MKRHAEPRRVQRLMATLVPQITTYHKESGERLGKMVAILPRPPKQAPRSMRRAQELGISGAFLLTCLPECEALPVRSQNSERSRIATKTPKSQEKTCYSPKIPVPSKRESNGGPSELRLTPSPVTRGRVPVEERAGHPHYGGTTPARYSGLIEIALLRETV